MIRRINTAPGLQAALGPYSQAVSAGGFVFVTGQVPLREGHPVQTFEDEVVACLENLRSVLEEAGSNLDSVVKVNAYLTDPAQRETFNRVYTRYFEGSKPARTTVCVSIWEISLEIECVAVVAGATP